MDAEQFADHPQKLDRAPRFRGGREVEAMLGGWEQGVNAPLLPRAASSCVIGRFKTAPADTGRKMRYKWTLLGFRVMS